jgi:inner membrane protein
LRIKTHLNGAILTGLVMIQTNTVSHIPIISNIPSTLFHYTGFITGCAIGGLIVDIDHIKSTAGRKFKIISITLFLLNKIFKALRMKYFAKLTGHRGLLHAPFLWMFFMGLLLCFSKAIAATKIGEIIVYCILGILIGAFSHLLLDFMTVSGIPLFLPFYTKNYHIIGFNTGNKIREWIFSTVFFVINLIIIANIMGVNSLEKIGIPKF